MREKEKAVVTTEGQPTEIVLPEGTREIIIRKGEAPPIKYPQPIELKGTLGAPAQFFKCRAIDPKEYPKVHLRIHNDIGKLELHIFDTDEDSEQVIIGELTKDTVIAKFKVNSEARWSVREFVKFIRTMRYYFADPAECNALVDNLNKWTVSVETVIKNHNNNDGNSLMMLEKKVGEVPIKSNFILSCPIFQGYPKVKFKVEIGLDPKSNQVDLFMISDELIELEIGQREKIIVDELQKFDEWDFSKVVMS